MSENEKKWACPWCAEKDKRIRELEEQVKELIAVREMLINIEKEQRNDEEK